jgi:hypothetical protein
MFLTLASLLFGKSTSNPSYTISYGSSKAKYKLINYFDLGCTHCAEFYRHVFPLIKKNFCEKGKVLFIYKPYPIHQETLIFMSCCLVLNPAQKQALFETLMEINTPVTTDIIRACMKVLKMPCSAPTSDVLQDALYLTSQHNFESLPVMFLDGKRLNDNDQDRIVPFLEETCR